jgi:hypothetical protein
LSLAKFELDWLRNCFVFQGADVGPEQAEILAIQALGWLLSQDDLFSSFLASSGAGLDDLRARASDPVFLASVLEFLTSDDSWVREFCDSFGHAYDAPLRARYALPGAEMVHWT